MRSGFWCFGLHMLQHPSTEIPKPSCCRLIVLSSCVGILSALHRVLSLSNNLKLLLYIHQSWPTCPSSDWTSLAIRSQRSLQLTGSSVSCRPSSQTTILCSLHQHRYVDSLQDSVCAFKLLQKCFKTSYYCFKGLQQATVRNMTLNHVPDRNNSGAIQWIKRCTLFCSNCKSSACGHSLCVFVCSDLPKGKSSHIQVSKHPSLQDRKEARLSGPPNSWKTLSPTALPDRQVRAALIKFMF